MKKTKRNNKPQEWQKDSSKIETSTVQYWVNGTMITAQLSNAEAKKMVNSGNAFVITRQAIGNLKNGEYNA